MNNEGVFLRIQNLNMNRDLNAYKSLRDSSAPGSKPKKRPTSQTKAHSNSPKANSRSTVAIKSAMIILPDSATNNMKQLRSVRFLAPQQASDPAALSLPQIIDARPVQEKTGKLARQYLQRQKNVDSGILKVITQSKVAHMEILKKNERDRELERLAKLNRPKANKSSIGDLLVDDGPPEGEEDNKLADGFVRSDRNMMMRKRDVIDQQKFELEQQKTVLVQRLNDALLKLDKFNNHKREMSQKLLDSMQFCRDLQKAVGANGLEDLASIASQQLQQEYQAEQKLGIQLKSQLQLQEQERGQVLERLKSYQGEKEVIVTEQDGNKRSFKVSQVSTQTKLEQVHSLKHQNGQCDQQISDAKRAIDLLEDQLSEQNLIVQKLQRERDSVLDQHTEMQHRFDHKECQERQGKLKSLKVHSMHVKLLALRMMQESLQSVLQRNKKVGFGQLTKVVWDVTEKGKAAWQLKQLIVGKERKRMVRAVQKLVETVFPGVKLQRLSDAVPVFYERQDLKSHFYHKWRSNFIKSTKRRRSQKQFCTFMVNGTKSSWLKVQKTFFSLWRNNINYDKNKIILLRNTILKLADLRAHSVLQRWKSFIQDQNFNTRMMLLSNKLTRKQMQSKVFQVLSEHTLKKRVRNRSRLVRAFKNLKVNKIRKLFVSQMEQWIEIKGKQIEIRHVQNPYGSLKLYNEKQKFLKTSEQLAQVNREISSVQNAFHLLSQIWLRKKQQRAIYALVHKPLQGKLAELFNYWKDLCDKNTWSHQTVLRGLVISTYKRKLRDAMSRWVYERHQIILTQDRYTIVNWKESISQVDQANTKTQHQINETEQLNKIKARNCLKRVINVLGKHYLRNKLQKWRRVTEVVAKTEIAARKICDRISIHFMRIAFNKYRKICKEHRQSMLDARKEQEYRLRLEFRAKKRIYKAIRTYALKTQTQFKCIKILLKKVDRHNLKKFVRTWKNFMLLHREHSLFQQERGDVIQIGKMSNEVGDVSDHKNRTMIELKSLQKILKTECKHILQKWVLRFHQGGLKYGFKTWCHQTQNLRHQASFTVFLKNQLSRNIQKTVLWQWKSCLKYQTRQVIEGRVSQRQVEIQRVLHDNLVRSKVSQKKQEKVRQMLSKILEQRNRWQCKFTKIVQLMISKKQKNFVSKNERYYLAQWRQFSKASVSSCKKLSTNVMKIFLQDAFNQIIQYNLLSNRDQSRAKATKRLDRITNRLLERVWFRKWISFMNQQELRIKKRVQAVTANEIKVHTQKVSKIHSQQSELMGQRTTQTFMYKVFQGWQEQAHLRKLNRQRQKEFNQKTEAYLIQRALLKWSERLRQTHKTRLVHLKMAQLTKQRVLKACFTKGFRHNQLLTRTLSTNLKRVFTVLGHLRSKTAFQAIKARSEINHEASLRDNEQSAFQLCKVIDKLKTNRLRLALGQMQHFVVADRSSYLKLKGCMLHRVTQSKRGAFMRWRDQAKKLEVADYNENWYGPVSLQAWHERVKFIQLKKLVCEDMQDEDAKVQQLVAESSAEDKSKMRRSVIRLMVHGDPDLRLLPIYFDRLKEHYKARKLWKFLLRQSNLTVHRVMNKHSLNRHFQRWRRTAETTKMELLKTPLEQLKIRFEKDQQKLNTVLDQDEDVSAALEEVHGQRDALFQGFIGSQKLAFSCAKASYQRAQSKAISRMSDDGNENLKIRIDSALQNNLDRIEALKQKIVYFEDANIVLCEGNDVNKSKAVRVVHQAREMEQLQNDVDGLSLESRHQEQTIKKLREDQLWLIDQLQQQDEMKHLLEKKQMYHHKRIVSQMTPPGLQMERENFSNAMNGATFDRHQVQQRPSNRTGTLVESTGGRQATSPLRSERRQ